MRWMKCSLAALTIAVFSMGATAGLAAPSTSFYVVAHEDDWQLFMGLNAAIDVPARESKTVFVHTTAGDAGLGIGNGGTPVPYYIARENSALSAIRFVANLGIAGAGPNAAASSISINGKNLHRVAYRSAVAYFLRLPDGNVADGTGYPSTGNQSLLLLASGADPTISAVDGSATYNGWADLVATLRAILLYEAHGSTDVWINVQDPSATINPHDHPDHTYTANAMLDAIASLPCVNASLFTGYVSRDLPINLETDDAMLQAALWGVTTSALTDSYHLSTWDGNHTAYLGRQYFRILRGTGGCGF